ncbi:MAG: hypothetical protein JRC99_10175 [Deltaproteobacteria bacterium]|nr:hypothetical protein [Deltaproteobacteria bacterium]
MSPKKLRPKVLQGVTIEVPSPCGKIYVVINSLDGKPQEIFVRFGKQGSCSSTISNALAVTISYALRSGTDIRDIVKGLKGNCCHRSPAYLDGKPVPSCVDAIGRAIETTYCVETNEDISEQSEKFIDEAVTPIPIFGRVANG